MVRTLTSNGETLIEYLARMKRKDAEKGYATGGERDTREIADFFGVSLATARRHLWAAVASDEVEAFDGGASGAQGNPIFWRIK